MVHKELIMHCYNALVIVEFYLANFAELISRLVKTPAEFFSLSRIMRDHGQW